MLLPKRDQHRKTLVMPPSTMEELTTEADFQSSYHPLLMSVAV